MASSNDNSFSKYVDSLQTTYVMKSVSQGMIRLGCIDPLNHSLCYAKVFSVFIYAYESLGISEFYIKEHV